MSDNEVRNSVTVSVKIKKPTVQYGSIEVMASATMALPDAATLSDIAEKEQELWGALFGDAWRQADMMQEHQLQMPVGATPVPEAPRVPTTAKPVNPPAAKPAESVSGWTKQKFPPKADARQVGQYWLTRILGFQKGEFTGKSGKPFNAIKLTLDNGQYGTKDTYVFHNHPAYPIEGTGWYAFFEDDMNNGHLEEEAIYAVLGCTGAEREGKLDVIPLAFASDPNDAPMLPKLGGDEPF